MKQVSRLCIALLGAATLLLAGCAAPPTATVAAGALTVNGVTVPQRAYDSLVSTEKRTMERLGITVSPGSSQGPALKARIQGQALRTLVRDAVIEQLAAARHVQVSQAEIDAAVLRIEQAFGGEAVLTDQLDQEGLSLKDFEQLFRYRLLDSKMRQADPAGYDSALQKALADAKVQAFVGPCQTQHVYPACAAHT